MDFILNLWSGSMPYLRWPGVAGLVVWVLSLGALFLLLFQMRVIQPDWGPAQWRLLGLFLAISAPATLFAGIRVQLQDALPVPGQLERVEAVWWMLLSAVPWVLGGGWLGPAGAFILSLFSGFILAIFTDHNPFTALMYGASGVLFGALIHQNYRTRLFAILRRPLPAAIIVALVYPILYLPAVLVWLNGSMAVEVDFAFRLLPASWVSFSIPVVLAGLMAEIPASWFRETWGTHRPLEPSPAERSIETRSLITMGWLVVLALVVLATAAWFQAASSARTLIEGRMENVASLAAEQVPSLLDIGQNLIQTAGGDGQLNLSNPELLAELLEKKLGSSQYFDHMILVDAEKQILAEVSRFGTEGVLLNTAEIAGVDLALGGVAFQYYTSPEASQPSELNISFLVPVPGGKRVLIGRTHLAGNPFSAPLLRSLDNVREFGGAGLLLDGAGRVLYHPASDMIGTAYAGPYEGVSGFAESATAAGEPIRVHHRQATGRDWYVVIEVPLAEVQALTLQIATPPLYLLVLLALISIALLWLSLRVVSGSLRELAQDALRIAHDPASLALPLDAGGDDEVGQLQNALETMRVALSDRMAELEQLLAASTGAASSLDFGEGVSSVLAAAVASGADSARIVLAPGALTENGDDPARSFGAGVASAFAYLDSQVFHLSRETSPLVIDDPTADSRLRILPGRAVPSGLLAIALRQEGDYLGVLWVAYRGERAIQESDVRFMSTLGGQAVQVAARARLFTRAEVERERLAAILTSTPDPVIVTDREDNLLLSNPAAWNLLGSSLEAGRGMPVDTLISHDALAALLKGAGEQPEAVEIQLDTGKWFVARATDVLSGSRKVGRICVLRDVTHFKELDAMKSEFVSTISHDLGSPLTLIRGYATMISVVGDLTDEQAGYVNKIVVGVDRMTNLVQNLLQLGRIEAGIDLHLEPAAPQMLVAHVVHDLQDQAEKSGVVLKAEQPAGKLPVVLVDLSLVERALHNLVSNAIKYTPSGGKVRVLIRFQEAAGQIEFVVQDTGIGIPLEHQGRLFEKFYRVPHRGGPRVRGTGLGLAIVKSVAERHGGRVWMKSKEGRGSVFVLSLPIQHTQSDQLRQEEEG